MYFFVYYVKHKKYCIFLLCNVRKKENLNKITHFYPLKVILHNINLTVTQCFVTDV